MIRCGCGLPTWILHNQRCLMCDACFTCPRSALHTKSDPYTHDQGHNLVQVEWAPPEHGDMVAAGAADGSVTVWEAAPGKRWKRLASLQSGRRSVTAMQFAPKQHGLLLAVASCDGYVR